MGTLEEDAGSSVGRRGMTGGRVASGAPRNDPAAVTSGRSEISCRMVHITGASLLSRRARKRGRRSPGVSRGGGEDAHLPEESVCGCVGLGLIPLVGLEAHFRGLDGLRVGLELFPSSDVAPQPGGDERRGSSSLHTEEGAERGFGRSD